MRVVIAVNPSSGRGRARPGAELCARLCRRLGHDAALVSTSDLGSEGLAPRLIGASALVVFGGDGTVHRALPALVETGVPVLHVPMGTENLFARGPGRGSGGEMESVLAAIERPVARRIDLGRCNGTLFALMCGVGPDAAVVGRVCAARRGAISHLSYVGPIAREVWSGRPSPLTVRADGAAVVDSRPGQAIVANCREYGGGLNPLRRADESDGWLDVLFVPAERSWRLAPWAALALLGAAERWPGSIVVRARRVEIEAPGEPAPVQLDGEAAGWVGGPWARTLDITVLPGALAVLGAG